MTVLITLTGAGADSGPFDLFSDVDGYSAAFEIGISKAFLLYGYPSSNVPLGTTQIMIKSTGELCQNFIIVDLDPLVTTTTSSTTVVPSTTTTTTTIP